MFSTDELIGCRVFAIFQSKDGIAHYLGDGIYEGDFPPPGGKKPPTFEEMLADPEVKKPPGLSEEQLRANHESFINGPLGTLLYKNPRIKLDNGDVVWGKECWWGALEQKDRALDGRTVVNVRIVRNDDGTPIHAVDEQGNVV
jgi:hypothetical protein